MLELPMASNPSSSKSNKTAKYTSLEGRSNVRIRNTVLSVLCGVASKRVIDTSLGAESISKLVDKDSEETYIQILRVCRNIASDIVQFTPNLPLKSSPKVNPD